MADDLSRRPAPRQAKPPRIDAHHHIWKLDRGDYTWLSEADGPALYRDWLPEELAPLLQRYGLDAAVLVHAAQTPEETRFMLEAARTYPFEACVVGYVDLASRSAPELLQAFSESPEFRGIRAQLLGLADPEWLFQPDVHQTMTALSGLGIRLDLCLWPSQMQDVLRWLVRYPALPVVINHMGYPPYFLGNGSFSTWEEGLTRFARDTRAFVKFSGVTWGQPQDWPETGYDSAFNTVFELFGPTRIMWASDWPQVNTDSNYHHWWALSQGYLARSGLSESEVEAVMGGAAVAFYGLEADCMDPSAHKDIPGMPS